MFAPISRFEAETAVPQPFPRSFGSVDLEFCHKDGATRAHRVFQSGVARARFPNVPGGDPPEAVLINTAGGLTGGDCVNVGVEMGSGTRAVITTQAHEKIYRSVLGDVSIAANLGVRAGAVLEWLPQPTILFDGARLCRQTHVELSGDASFLGVEAVIFGRSAMNETVKSGSLSDRWTIVRDGRLIHAERFALAGDIAAKLAKPSVLANNRAMATIRYVALDAESRLESVRALVCGLGAVSAWNGMLLARLVAEDGYNLSRALAHVLAGMRGRALPSVWSI